MRGYNTTNNMISCNLLEEFLYKQIRCLYIFILAIWFMFKHFTKYQHMRYRLIHRLLCPQIGSVHIVMSHVKGHQAQHKCRIRRLGFLRGPYGSLEPLHPYTLLPMQNFHKSNSYLCSKIYIDDKKHELQAPFPHESSGFRIYPFLSNITN